MKQGIHPDYHKITITMTDGTKYETRSTWGKEGDVLQLDVDTKTHPAWVGGVNLRKTGQMEKFNNKFAFLEKGASGPKKQAQAQPVATEASKKAKEEKAKAASDKAEKKEAKAKEPKPEVNAEVKADAPKEAASQEKK